MYVITVVPLKKGNSLDSLSYFSSQSYPEGTIVSIPVRNTSTLGLVTASKEASAAKTALRAATFSLRKLPIQVTTNILGKAYIKTAEELAQYYAAPLGTVLYNLLPPEIRHGEIPLPHTHYLDNTTTHPPQILIASTKERYLTYRSIVRETFAHSGSVLIVVPSSPDAYALQQALEHGIEDRVVVLTSASTKSEIKKAYANLEDFSKTKLIIATTTHAIIERHDVTLVILEHARSSYYKELTRPYLDYRDVLTIHARHMGRKIILADTMVRTEDENLRRREIYHTYGEVPKRIELPGKLEIIVTKKSEDSTVPFQLFDPATLKTIQEVLKKKGKIFLFAARRGLAPLIACMDCGFIFRSKESGAPYSLLRTKKDGVEERWFVCSISGERIRAENTCTNCGSWRLKERGVGIQFVYDEIHRLIPNTPTILFDHITARSYKKAIFLRDTFYKTKGAILLGTQMALPYLTHDVDLSVIVNMDALLATPTWRLEEENFALLLSLREITKSSVIVQTRTPETEILEHAKQGALEHFYTEELGLRKTFNYPPYCTFIHFTWQGSPEIVTDIEKTISELFKEYKISTYQNPTTTYESPIWYGLIRIPRDSWPDQKLVDLIRRVHPSVRVVINPDRII